MLLFGGVRRLRAAAVVELRAERDQLYRLLARSYPNGGTFLFNRQLRYVLVEGTALAEVGLSSEGTEGRLITEVLAPDELAVIEPVYRAALAGETTAFETPYRGQHYRVSVGPTRDEQGVIVGGLAMTQQITEQYELREQLQQSQKMEAIAQLAGAVAHDFNNQLLAIRGYAELAQAHCDDPPANGWIAEVIKAADQAASLTRQLLTFSRKQVAQPQLVSLNKLVADTEAMLGRLLGERIEIVTALDPALAAVKADPGQLNQVLVNLAVNARDAMLLRRRQPLARARDAAGAAAAGAEAATRVLHPTPAQGDRELRLHLCVWQVMHLRDGRGLPRLRASCGTSCAVAIGGSRCALPVCALAA